MVMQIAHVLALLFVSFMFMNGLAFFVADLSMKLLSKQGKIEGQTFIELGFWFAVMITLLKY